MKILITEALRSLWVTLIFVVILCGAYPAIVWIAGMAIFRDQATGQLVVLRRQVIGSRLIGQGFTRREYFHGRPSAAGEKGYDAVNSSGSNLGPTNPKLADRVKSDVERLLSENPELKSGEIPVDLITTSASGLDPHISPAAAEVQVMRVARARALEPDQVKKLVQSQTRGPQWGVFGEATVNVLELNLALDDLKKGTHEISKSN